MSQHFAVSAANLAGAAARLLGWRPHEFWQATPAELALSLAPPSDHTEPPDRETIRRMMERDDNG